MMDSLFCCFTNEERYAPIIHPMKEKEEVSKRFGIFPGNSSQRIATVRSHSFDCPAGNNRRNSSRMLIPTGGTALQAVDREEALQKDMISVSVPENVQPGQEILVMAPDGSGRCIKAIVPQGALPGHTFLVKFDSSEAAVMGVPVEQRQDLFLNTTEEEKKSDGGFAGNTGQNNSTTPLVVGTPVPQGGTEQAPPHNHHVLQHQESVTPDGSMRITVPYGSGPGDQINVRLEDGRIIQATIPQDPDITEFYLKIPPKNQNFHDNAIVYGAPMAVGPFLM